MSESEHWHFKGPLKLLNQRAFLMAEIRQFFAARQVMEVSTPVLSTKGNTDVEIEMFVTDGLDVENSQAFLRTSPEFFHKRLLASGSGDIFEIAKVFRKGELTALHNPEFTLLEWYRLGFTLTDLFAEVCELIEHLNAVMQARPLTFKTCSYQQLFESYLGINPFAIEVDELNDFCTEKGYVGSQLTRTEALDFLFAVAIQPLMVAADGKSLVVVVYDFPIEAAALAQAHPVYGDRCLRFEILWDGVELANGYQELTDAQEQLERFQQDNKARAQKGRDQLPIDDRLIAALAAGLPACSGVAMGLERLLMCLLGQQQIQDVMGFDANNS
ncbi:EF-P lysine aminoacylase EpmA [Marinicella sp. S1101]|uniref:EF-P lysine aminoacylase EpmA n=1 Tax=Marinicella marina TaxID=2996016 RepID=UPI002260C9CE|nr:EF-P lysine aminoacylase EpmA [Marinicella marina]MCX7554779.1 EF-P lysine aminoacylase EpmA [Marinicella marina]MDJ1140988.1 EF-P lysine aminoacylase EpmA [Marinicella marina]